MSAHGTPLVLVQGSLAGSGEPARQGSGMLLILFVVVRIVVFLNRGE